MLSGSVTIFAIKEDDAKQHNVARRAQHPSFDTRTLGSMTKSEHFVSQRLDENVVLWLPAPFAFMSVGVGEAQFTLHLT